MSRRGLTHDFFHEEYDDGGNELDFVEDDAVHVPIFGISEYLKIRKYVSFLYSF